MRFDDIIAMERKELLRDSIFDLLSDYGEIPESLKNRILDTYDIATLKRWLKLAARAGSIEEFTRQMD